MLEYFFLTAQDDMKRMASGYLLEKIIQDTIQKISECNSEKKIFLYSAHENNLAQFLILLGVFDTIVPRHVPNYGAHILVEIHKINGEFGVMVSILTQLELPIMLTIFRCITKTGRLNCLHWYQFQTVEISVRLTISWIFTANICLKVVYVRLKAMKFDQHRLFLNYC